MCSSSSRQCVYMFSKVENKRKARPRREFKPWMKIYCHKTVSRWDEAAVKLQWEMHFMHAHIFLCSVLTIVFLSLSFSKKSQLNLTIRLSHLFMIIICEGFMKRERKIERVQCKKKNDACYHNLSISFIFYFDVHWRDWRSRHIREQAYVQVLANSHLTSTRINLFICEHIVVNYRNESHISTTKLRLFHATCRHKCKYLSCSLFKKSRGERERWKV
jgi:hypothetical protein